MIDIKNKIKKYLVKKDNKFNSIFEINKWTISGSNHLYVGCKFSAQVNCANVS